MKHLIVEGVTAFQGLTLKFKGEKKSELILWNKYKASFDAKCKLLKWYGITSAS